MLNVAKDHLKSVVVVVFMIECKRTRTPHAYVVSAGTEHERFKNLFPFWEDNKAVQELVCKVLHCLLLVETNHILFLPLSIFLPPSLSLSL